MAKRGNNLHIFQSIGHCIYCGKTRKETKLTEEHIFPFALNGNLVLPDSSCIPCAEHINKNGENFLLRNHFGIIRAKLQTWSRNPKDRPRVFECRIRDARTGESKKIEIPIQDYPLHAWMVLNEPGLITGHTNATGLNTFRLGVIQLPSRVMLPQHLSIETESIMKTGVLELVLAKIALSYCVATSKLNSSYRSLLPDIVTGKNPYIWDNVGGFTNEESAQLIQTTPDHHGFNRVWIKSKTIGLKEYLVCGIQLFAHLPAPIYQVIVGEKL